MDKVELLRKLDIAAELSSELSKLQNLLSQPNRVKLMVTTDDVRVYQVDTGAYFLWDMTDPRTAIACLAIAGEYEPVETSLISMITKHCKNVIDVGANVGYYAVIIPLVSPNVQNVYAFEPLPEAYECLSQNVRLNGLGGQVFSFNNAVSNNITDLELFVPKVFGRALA